MMIGITWNLFLQKVLAAADQGDDSSAVRKCQKFADRDVMHLHIDHLVQRGTSFVLVNDKTSTKSTTLLEAFSLLIRFRKS